MRILVRVLVGWCLFQMCSAQTIDPQRFENEIHELNNKRQYEKSVVRIYEVLYNPKSTDYDRYNAYLQKAFTYKRIFNYTETFNNLSLALKEGLNSSHRKEVETRVAIERFFIIFDLQKVDEMRKMIEENKNLDLSVVDEETRALYLSALAIVEITDGKYDEGNRKIDQAIAIFSRVSPKDLPNIYGKKMFLYRKLNQPEKVEKAFDKAMFFAKKYKSDIYIKNLAVDMWEFYTYQNNLEKAKYYRKIADDLKYDDNFILNANSLKLTDLEKKIQYEKALADKASKQQEQIIIAIISVLSICLFLWLLGSHARNKKRRVLAELENAKMRDDLEKILQGNDDSAQQKTELKTDLLTDRQKEIVDLVKEGKTNKEIGSALYISENTVKYHLKIIYNALGIENRNALK